MATITGTLGDDTLDGNVGIPDTIDGLDGSDTVSYAGAGGGVLVDLSSGFAREFNDGTTDELVSIENVIGSSFDDFITGDGNANVLDGGAGNDTVSYAGAGGGIGVLVDLSFEFGIDFSDGVQDSLISIENVIGSSFDDFLTGDENANVLEGADGNDALVGGGGSDMLDGGAGLDALDGGDGVDTASYASATHGAIVDLSAGAASDDGHGTADTLFSIENLRGSAFGDSLTGDGFDNVLDGAGGNDALVGGGGSDTASYASATLNGVTVDLRAGTASDDGSGGSDTLSGIENVSGSAFGDSLTGDDNANSLAGGAGADVFHYSFDVTGGGGKTLYFTDFFAAQHGSKVVVDGEVADGTNMGQFSSSYAHWLKMLVKEEGLGTGGLRDLTQFGEPETFTWKAGNGKKAVTHEVSYFDTWTSGDGAEETVTSTDGLDTILDFTAEDVLNFSGITEQQFLANFSANSGQSGAGDAGIADTVITIDGDSSWSLTLADVQLNLNQVADQTVFS